MTRKDSAFDAVAKFDDKRIGVGLKTWIHTRDLTYQKVAEFNKVAPLELSPLIADEAYDQLIYKVSELRNERIRLDKRQYNTNYEIYHNITRDNNKMNLVETSYDLIQMDSLKLLSQNGKTYIFSDGLNVYKYYASKSVLLKSFDASDDKVLERIPILQYEDPFTLLNDIELPETTFKESRDVIYLPIYSDTHMKVEEKSGFNAWNAASKTKGSNRPRPDYEAYIPIPKWIHQTFPNFFGFNALDKEQRNNATSFSLLLPDDRKIEAIVTQDFGKSLQTNPQNILGKWILHDVLGLQPRELLTMEHLLRLGVDSLKLSKIDDKNFEIELAETYAFEKWKIEIEDKIAESGGRKPALRPHLLEEDE